MPLILGALLHSRPHLLKVNPLKMNALLNYMVSWNLLQKEMTLVLLGVPMVGPPELDSGPT